MVIILGSISVIVFGLCLRPIGEWVDERISRGAAALLALTSKCCRSRSLFRAVKVSKQAGEVAGFGIHRVDRVAAVDKGSLCEHLIFPGDTIHSINGHSLTSSMDAAAKIREACELHLLVSSPSSAGGEATERRLLHAKLVVAYLASQCVVGLCALVAYVNPEPVHEGWSGFDYYYFAFVTVSSIGFGDFAMGPKEGTFLGFMRLFTQATTIFVGMAFFNALAGVGGDWAGAAAERTLSCLARHMPPLCESGAIGTEAAEPFDAGPDKVYELHDQSEMVSGDEQHAELALARASATARTVTRFGARLKQHHAHPPAPAEAAFTRASATARTVTRFGARLKQQHTGLPAPAEVALTRALATSERVTRFGAQLKQRAASSSEENTEGGGHQLKLSSSARLLNQALDVALDRRSLRTARILSRCRKGTSCLVPWLVLFFAMILLGGYIFMSIEAGDESMQAQVLRDEENAIRAVAVIKLKGDQSNASRVHWAANASVDRVPTFRRARGPNAIRARLLDIGSMAEGAQAAAVEEIVSDFTEVVKHESGCDRLADLTLLMLSKCKNGPPSPISLQWSFNGAAFFMLTIMTTIGYGALPARAKPRAPRHPA